MDGGILVAIIIVLAIWVLALTALFLRFYLRLQKITKTSNKKSILDILDEVFDKEQKIDKDLSLLQKKVDDLLQESQFYIQKVGLVRFNPFKDTGGDQSFILSLINNEDSGIVISGLHTRNGTRWYAKKVVNGKGVEYELSADEAKAIKEAKKK